MIKYLVLGEISKDATWGSAITPSFFKSKSPIALVTANYPLTLLLNMAPPIFL